jgi:hypothetical protein
MAARSRTTVGDLPTSATGIGGPPAKEAVCTAARATPPPLPATLPLTVSQASLPVAVPPEGARKPGLIAWAPVGIAAVVAAVLIGSLALLIRRTPADADPEAAPEVALATGQPQLPPSPPTPLPQGERGEKGSLSESPVKMEPASPALPAPPAPDDPPPANPAAATPSLPPEENPPAPGQAQPAAAAAAVDHRYGTSVDFVDSPTEAAEKALKEKKLLFVLHVAGNFEKDCFT